MCIKGSKSLVSLARNTVESFVSKNIIINSESINISDFNKNKAGVFVTIYKNDQLRGCIGTIAAVQKNIIEEVIVNAISSCSKDHRFTPVQNDELSSLKYSVSVLKEPEAIYSIEDLDTDKYGVIVSASGNKRGLLLPRLEGIKTIRQQVNHAMIKGGIDSSEKIWLYRFEVIDYKE